MMQKYVHPDELFEAVVRMAAKMELIKKDPTLLDQLPDDGAKIVSGVIDQIISERTLAQQAFALAKERSIQ